VTRVAFQELTIDLQRPPAKRWALTPEQCDQARALFAVYQADLGLSRDTAVLLTTTAKNLIRDDHWREMEAIGEALGQSVDDVALCNSYYDILKAVLGSAFGCTAFAVDSPDGVLHARNLDWWTQDAALARYTTVCHFVGGPHGRFTTIGWPGFVGAFSGVAPGRFAVTLNAVLSLEPPQLANPVVLLLRTVLEEAASFDQALCLLSQSAIPCDCLLLLTGVVPGEAVVIERTPTRHAIRRAEGGHVSVTNGYRKLIVDQGPSQSGLLSSSCERFDRIDSLIGHKFPQCADDCFVYLSDPAIRMNMTVQQMVFRAATGECWLK
jgi:acid ceramidase